MLPLSVSFGSIVLPTLPSLVVIVLSTECPHSSASSTMRTSSTRASSPDSSQSQCRPLYISLPPSANADDWCVLDCHHGRVLMIHTNEASNLVVWDPISGEQKHVPMPDYLWDSSTATVLCAVDGCNHLDCSSGAFHLVFKGTEYDAQSIIWVSIWSVPISIHIDPILEPIDVIEHSLLVEGKLYSILEDGERALEYDMGQHVLSVIGLPPLYQGNKALVAAKNVRLGIAGVKGYNLHLWWRLDHNSDLIEWVPGRVIELDMMLSIDIGDPTSRLHVVGFAQSAGSIFVSTNSGMFIVEIESGQVRKINKGRNLGPIFPFERFYTPGTFLMPIHIYAF